jgi:hypothetical protein
MKYLDHFEQMVPAKAPTPIGRDRQYIETVSIQLLIAGYEPISSQFLCTIMFAIHQPESYRLLAQEIRNSFKSYDDITAEALAPLQFLRASLI